MKIYKLFTLLAAAALASGCASLQGRCEAGESEACLQMVGKFSRQDDMKRALKYAQIGCQQHDKKCCRAQSLINFYFQLDQMGE